MKNLIYIVFILFFFISCKKENDPALILITPLKNTYYSHPGQVLSFNINCSSNSNLSHLKIFSKTETTFSVTILDSALNSKSFSMTFQYKVPVFYDTTNINLIFTLSDVNGNSNSIAKIINVTLIDRLLTETAGHEMYSHLCPNYDAFNLSTLLPLHSQLSDSADIHILDGSVDSVNHNALSRKWISLADLKFVRFNGFNYANATISIIKNAYNSGLQDQYITNLVNGDIIITKLGSPLIDTGFVAIKIVNIIDNDSTLTDKYIFNIKK
jgi:hypothetical protein